MGFRSHRSLSLSPADTEKLVSQKRLSEEMASSDKLCREREDKTKAKTTHSALQRRRPAEVPAHLIPEALQRE